MPDFLTRRNGTWHFVRRVPAEFSAFDKRGIVRHSTKVRVSSDRTGRRAVRVAERLNSELEDYWSQSALQADPIARGYDDTRRRARSLGFEYIENGQLLALAAEKRLERLEALVAGSLENDATARAASRREIPLVGAALAAMKLRPNGFPRYRDKSSSLSATLNKFLLENHLRPTKSHTVYSLRHSFKDRLIAAEAEDSLIDSLMGHCSGKPKYGKGPSLELKT